VSRVGRNDPCPCGSGKKYKKCCLLKERAPVDSLVWQRMRRAEGELLSILLKHAKSYLDPGAAQEAWDEFTLWNGEPMGSESDSAAELEAEVFFIPWFLYTWIPDNAEFDEAEHYPEMQIAMHYAREQGSRLDPFQLRFIEEICSQPYSFYVVLDVDSGRSLLLRDILLQREIRVHERQASTMLSKGVILYTRIVTMESHSIMVGCAPTALPARYHHELIDVREDLASASIDLDQDYLLESDIQLRTVYRDICDRAKNAAFPKLLNTDDDPLQLNKIYYTLKCTPREALNALATLSLAPDVEALLDDAEFDEQGELVSITFPWLKKGNQKHAAWDNTVMGQIVIKRGNYSPPSA